MYTAFNLESIAKVGGSLVIDAKGYTALNLQSIARAGKANGCKLFIKNVSHLTALNLQSIAKENPGHVTFDLTT